jgi:hypothetical protein
MCWDRGLAECVGWQANIYLVGQSLMDTLKLVVFRLLKSAAESDSRIYTHMPAPQQA